MIMSLLMNNAYDTMPPQQDSLAARKSGSKLHASSLPPQNSSSLVRFWLKQRY